MNRSDPPTEKKENDSETSGGGGDETRKPPNIKLARVIEKYELSEMGERLERNWLGESGEQESVRDLADMFNRTVLAAAMEAQDMNVLDGEVENLYRLLTEDDISSGKRTEARKRLEKNGVDVEQVLGDFVSHQSVYNYLTEYRGVDKASESTDERNQKQTAEERVQRLQNRLAAVTERTFGHLNETDEMHIGEFDVLVDVMLLCKECGNYYEAAELLKREACECSHARDE